MMKHSLIIAGILLVMTTCAFAVDNNVATQTFNTRVDAIARLNTSTVSSTELAIVAPDTGGDVPADVTATSTLKYTNVQAAATFKIGAEITTGTVPAGTLLKVVSAAPAAQHGAPGTAATQVTLNNTASQPIISTIGSCATGTGAGAVLTYTFGVDPNGWANLVPAASTGITVTYTLSSTGG